MRSCGPTGQRAYRPLLAQRQQHAEQRALAFLALHLNAPVVRTDDLVGDEQTQSQAGAAFAAFGTYELAEDALQTLRADADAVVAHLDAGAVCTRHDTDVHRLASPVAQDRKSTRLNSSH